MKEVTTSLPIYLYAVKYGNDKQFHFGGDLCEGRKLTKEEE